MSHQKRTADSTKNNLRTALNERNQARNENESLREKYAAAALENRRLLAENRRLRIDIDVFAILVICGIVTLCILKCLGA